MKTRTRIKICGVTDVLTAKHAAACGADAIGLVFVEHSPRAVKPERAAELMMRLPPLITAIGVVRDLDVEAYAELEQVCPCALMQLHGDEDDATVAACGPGVIKAIPFRPDRIAADLRRWCRLAEVDAVLVDGPEPGAGLPIDWHALAAAYRAVPIPKPLFLAGGLTPENVAEAVRIVRPYAVDVSSGVESERGVKDPALIEAFCAAVRQADA